MVFPGFFKPLIFIGLCSCQLGYIANSAYHQADILRRRVPLEQAAEKFSLTEEQKNKITLTVKVRNFMASSLKLNVDENFATYVHLDREYVTYAVSAAPKNKLEHYKWYFPIIGSVPYKGYFNQQDAQSEAQELAQKDLDVHVRGVAAYSTLGWFSDPLLSSMLRYENHDLVNTLIHETVHANLYIPNQSAFNERVASYLGLLGVEEFYQNIGKSNEIGEKLANEQADELLFSQFISQEISALRDWYTDIKDQPQMLAQRDQRFKAIQKRFTTEIMPKLKGKQFAGFAKIELNNARLLLFDLYMAEFSDFEKVARKKGRNFKTMFAYLKSLENQQDPVTKLKTDGDD